MKEKETNYAPSYEELEVLEECLTYINIHALNHMNTAEDALYVKLRKVIKSLHHKHMDYSLRDVKLNKIK